MDGFKYKYKIDEKSVRKMIISGISPKAMIQSALIPTFMFLVAWYLGKIESQPFGYFCFACGVAMLIWIGVQTNKLVKKTYSTLTKRYHSKELLVKVEINDEKIFYSVWNRNICERNEEYFLSDMLAFSENGNLIKVTGKEEKDKVYIIVEPSERIRLAQFLKSKDIKEKDRKSQIIGKLASIGLIVLSFVLAVYSFFPSQANVVPFLEAWEKKGGYTAQVDWTKNSFSEFDCQVSSVWIEKDKIYRIERSEEKGETQQVILSSFDNGKEKCIRLDAKGYVKLIEEKEITRTDFFLEAIIDPCEDAFLFGSPNKIQPSPYFSWKKEGNQINAALEDTDGFAQYRVGKEEDSYTEEQLNSMDTMERMNLHYSGRIKPDHADFTFTVQDKRIIKISFDELVRISESEEEREGTISVQDLSIQSSAKEQVEDLFERSVRHGSTIDLDQILQ